MRRTLLLTLALTSCTTKPTCPQDMVLIPAGKFMMGHADRPYESPLHQVAFAQPFCIDGHEVTVQSYARCMEAGACTEPRQWLKCNSADPELHREQHPQNCIDWYQSRTFCEWAKKRLPTEPEWEYAARGSESRRFPWGEQEPDGERTHWSGGGGKRARGTAAVGTHPGDVSQFGVLDMGGNVGEWVEFTPEQLRSDEQASEANERRPVKGSGWTNGQDAKPSWIRWVLDARGNLGQASDRGVRCAATLAAP